MTRLRGTLLAAAVPLLLLSACARPIADGPLVGDASGPASGGPESSAVAAPGPDNLVLRTESYGGFVAPDQNVGRLPGVSVYGDGRVLSEGPVPAIYPGPALPNVQVQAIAPEMVRQLIREGLSAGVRNGTDLGQPGVADAPTTRITVVDADGPQVVTVNALGEAQADDPRLTAAQRQTRAKLAAYEKKLSGLPVQSGMPQPVAYQPAALAVFVSPYVAPAQGPAAPAKAWPGPALPAAGGAARPACLSLTGAQKDTVLAAAKDAKATTPWTAGSAKWHVVFRPLLPDESGCAAVRGAR